MNEIIKKNGITYGIVLGVISILTTTLIYVIDLDLFVNMWVGVIGIVINIIIGVIIVSKTKRQLNNIITFKEAFTVYFIAAAIGGLISILFYYLLFNVVDPGAKATVQELTVKMTVGMMEKFGAPSAEINKAVEELQKTDNYSIGSLLKGYAFALIMYAVFGLILALIFRSKPAYKE
jgi:low temperature requirement protein LtrA